MACLMSNDPAGFLRWMALNGLSPFPFECPVRISDEARHWWLQLRQRSLTRIACELVRPSEMEDSSSLLQLSLLKFSLPRSRPTTIVLIWTRNGLGINIAAIWETHFFMTPITTDVEAIYRKAGMAYYLIRTMKECCSWEPGVRYENWRSSWACEEGLVDDVGHLHLRRKRLPKSPEDGYWTLAKGRMNWRRYIPSCLMSTLLKKSHLNELIILKNREKPSESTCQMHFPDWWMRSSLFWRSYWQWHNKWLMSRSSPERFLSYRITIARSLLWLKKKKIIPWWSFRLFSMWP